MKALVCTATSSNFDHVALRDEPAPEPCAGQSLIRVIAAGLNFPDLLMLKGVYQHKPEIPFVIGMEYAGIIEEITTPTAGLAVGDRVAGGGKTGAFAEYTLSSNETLMKIPQKTSDAAAATYSAAYSTAHVALINRARLAPGETLLVHGGSGGVSLAAIDVGKMLGARVIATTGTPEKRQALRDYGADDVLYSGDGFREAVKELTEGRGADVIFDPVGGDVFDESTRCIAFDGRLLVIGFAGGRIPNIATNLPLIKGYSVVGVRAGEYMRRHPEVGKRIRKTIWDWLSEGRTHPKIHAELPLSDWKTAFEMMRDRKLVGRIVLRP